jgi:hypothetical protein
VRPFPLWTDLTAAIVNGLYPAGSVPTWQRESAQRQANSTSGALRLAEEYEAAFGRDALLIDTISDPDYVPGPLYSRLLNLPWADVLTTNYDTLLERGAFAISARKYDVVRTAADIPRAVRPRIVKLHGSFPATRPFVITEEDFRTYPRRYASLVNLAQQVVMEAVVCLLGFSGDDPDFLYWTGWVRDHLGDATPQIYLCGLDQQSPARRDLLRRRHVVPIDLSPRFPRELFASWDDRHAAAIEWFLCCGARPSRG